MEDFINISGYLNVISGISLLIYWYSFAIFMPYRELSSSLAILVNNRHWKWINTLGVMGAAAGLSGQAGIYLIQMVRSLYPDKFQVRSSLNRLYGSDAFAKALDAGTPAAEIIAAYQDGLAQFKAVREKYLMY